jgi:hypothetical protein
MQIEPAGKHYTYRILNFDSSKFPVNYDKKKFPRGFDTINIDCYGDGSLRNMFLSHESEWVTVDTKSDIEKIVELIEESLKKQNLANIMGMS